MDYVGDPSTKKIEIGKNSIQNRSFSYRKKCFRRKVISFATMIYPDLTLIFERYYEWDFVVRIKYLRYASTLMKRHDKILYKDQQYHNIEDLKVDLDAEFYPLDAD